MDLKQKLKFILMKIKKHEYKDYLISYYLSETAFMIFFLIGLDEVKFDEDEQKEFAPLISDTLDTLFDFIKSSVDCFGPGKSYIAHVVRSGVEYLIQDYRWKYDSGPFQRSNSLGFEIDLQVEDEGVYFLDKKLSEWKKKGFKFFNEIIPQGIPSSHFWWSKVENENENNFGKKYIQKLVDKTIQSLQCSVCERSDLTVEGNLEKENKINVNLIVSKWLFLFFAFNFFCTILCFYFFQIYLN